MPAHSNMTEAIRKALREETVVVGTSNKTGPVLVLVEQRANGEYDYVPLARVMTPVLKVVNE